MDNTKSIALINKYRGQIMGFSAICIVFFHLWECQLSPSSPLRLLYWLEHCISGMGYFGVDIFFLLSGIGLSYAIGKYGLKEFWLRRFRRLVVPRAGRFADTVGQGGLDCAVLSVRSVRHRLLYKAALLPVVHLGPSPRHTCSFRSIGASSHAAARSLASRRCSPRCGICALYRWPECSSPSSSYS